MQKTFLKFISTLLLVLVSFNTYATKPTKDNYDYSYNYDQISNTCSVYDPYESFNRKIFMFNGIMDMIILRPIAKVYGKVTNNYTKARVNSFTSNVSEPLSTVNYGLQGKGKGVFKSFWRFAINSTFGLAGMFDIASKFGLEAEQQTFGNTLAHYGVGSGPYIVIPFIGGKTARDLMDPLVLNSALNPTTYVLHQDFIYTVTGVDIIRKRDQIMPFTDYITKNSPDPYIAVRDATIKAREKRMNYPAGFYCPRVKQ